MDRQEQDLRELVFGDALSGTPDAELQAISNDPSRRDELNRLLQLREALLSVGEDEPPRRTVLAMPPFAEHKAWWRTWFGAPGWGFAGACALAVAMLFHAVWAPMQPASKMMSAGVETMAESLQAEPEAAVRTEIAAERSALPGTPAEPQADERMRALVDASVDAAVRKVRAEMAIQHQQETIRLVAATENRLRGQYEQEMLEVREAVYFMKKQFGRQLVANVALASEAQ